MKFLKNENNQMQSTESIDSILKNSVWITWETQRRNESVSALLGIKLVKFDIAASRLLRYIILIPKTILFILKNNPPIIFVQNPSLILAFIAVLLGMLIRKPVIVDAHNAGILPMDGRSKVASLLVTFISRNAAITIVTNESIARLVSKKGGEYFVLPDPIPLLKRKNTGKMTDLPGKYNILFICTWADDEPYLEVIKAASLLDDNIYIHITGNSRGKESSYKDDIPDNVNLTGFLSESEFVEMLFVCDGIIDLTTRDDCLVCGAYEAVAAETPVMLSDKEALKYYFNKGALYTDNTAKDIAYCIKSLIDNHAKIKKEIIKLKSEIIKNEKIIENEFKNKLEQLLV